MILKSNFYMEYEKILFEWEELRSFNSEYDNLVNTINIFLKHFYFTECRFSQYRESYGFKNYIKYYYIKNNIIYMFLYTGVKNIILRCDLNIKNNYLNDNIYNIDEIFYINIKNEDHLREIIIDLGLWHKSERNDKIELLLNDKNVKPEHKFSPFLEFYKEHLLHIHNHNEDIILNYFNSFRHDIKKQ